MLKNIHSIANLKKGRHDGRIKPEMLIVFMITLLICCLLFSSQRYINLLQTTI